MLLVPALENFVKYSGQGLVQLDRVLTIKSRKIQENKPECFSEKLGLRLEDSVLKTPT